MATPHDLLIRLQDAYWATYRFLRDIKYVPREVKWFIQRGRRGWADCDTWSFDYYIARVCVGGLKKLRSYGNGTPMHVFPPERYSSDVKLSKEERDRIDDNARKLWTEQLDTMIDGFQASIDANDAEYFDLEKWKECERRRINGMLLFVEHFNSLWD